ncbi:homeobox-leucine zipper protein ATHB-12-like isoform X2 [Benincasa hispida]|uniref:homeobox-leucine zipper protein ATHB-12-like isoform X2 n=1 Tax=Benincasa hispida TaxID=102211 RepID=UPI0019028C59|nr:homeobox-leucine zipper protein ATHB-12-like isoform X2 [Benincasa hispida]
MDADYHKHTLLNLIEGIVYSTEVMDRNDNFTIPNFETEAMDSSQTCSTPRRKKKSNNNMNKRRLSDEQIRSLETIFYSTDSRLDSRKKVQLATELGLQPRQIAIWFQNRRARWKSKEMENNFRSLKAIYDNLESQFKTLQEENNSMLSQLQKLNVLLQGPCVGNYSNDISRTTRETQERPKSFQDELELSVVTYMNNNYNTNKKCIANGEGKSDDISHVEEQACQLLNLNGLFESTSEKLCSFSFDSDGDFFEYQSCSSSVQGPNFWG